jgi:nicotinamide-nucleotide amidase
MINASIITIGDELLIGQIVDTNSAWLGQQLNDIGVWVTTRIAVGDKKDSIVQALDNRLAFSDIVIITGGLGPTADDITKPLLCEYFGGKMYNNEKVKAHVIQFFERRGRPIIDANIAQANVPDVAEVLWNQYGTAPGMLFKKEAKLIFSLPGVPLEMKDIMLTSGLEIIKSNFPLPKVLHRTLVTAGKGESFVAVMLRDFEANLPNNIRLAYLPKLGVLRLRLTSVNTEETELDKYFLELQKVLEHILVANKDAELEEVIGDLLKKNNLSLVTAESCTGGAIANRITNISGSSQYFKGAIVSYHSEVKIKNLGVDEALIKQLSEVSEPIAQQMAEHARTYLHADLAISITGYLEHEDKDLQGLAYIGISNGTHTEVYKTILPYDRVMSKELAVNLALNYLRVFISKNYTIKGIK